MIPHSNNPLGQLSKAFKTRWTVSASETIYLPLVSDGTYNMLVDWGDGSSEAITSYTNNTHTYTNAGTYDITIQGTCTAWNFQTVNTSKDSIVAVLNWGDIGLSSLVASFQSCSNLASVAPYMPDIDAFSWVFSNCSSLTSIPKNLLYKCTTSEIFNAIFYNSGLAEIPAGLFDKCVSAKQFQNTFYGCDFTSIPAGLFDKNPLVTNFYNCFPYCTSLEAIPSGLFDNNTVVTNYKQCFYGCTALTGNAPELWNLVPEPYGLDCFYDCTGLTNYASIPTDWK